MGAAQPADCIPTTTTTITSSLPSSPQFIGSLAEPFELTPRHTMADEKLRQVAHIPPPIAKGRVLLELDKLETWVA